MSVEQIRAVETVGGPVLTHRQPPQQHYGPPLPNREQWQSVATSHVLPAVQQVSPLRAATDELRRWRNEVEDDENARPCMPTLQALSARDKHSVCTAFLAELEVGAGTMTAEAFEFCRSQCHRMLGRGQRDPGVLQEDQQVQLEVEYAPPVLPSTDGVSFVLYVYSGHMRPGDLVQTMAELSQAYQQDIQVIPLDVVHHAHLCDLLNPMLVHFGVR